MSEGEMVKFQELVLCSRSDHDEAAPWETEDGEGLILQHDRLVKAAAEIKATTTSSRNKKFVPEEIRQMASNAVKCMDPVEKKTLAQDCPESSTRLRGGKGGAAQREGDQQACGHEALGQWPRQ